MPSSKILVVGPAVVDRLVYPDGSIGSQPGGTAIIVTAALAAAARRLNFSLSVELEVTVGDDPEGKQIRDFVDGLTPTVSGGLKLSSQRQTRLNEIAITPEGQWSIKSSTPTQGKYLSEKNPTVSMFDDVFVGAATSLLSGQPDEATRLLLATRTARRFISLSRSGQAYDRLQDKLQPTDWIICNLDELRGASGVECDTPTQGIFHALGWGQAIVTAGGRGCWLYENSRLTHHIANSVVSSNTLGAGDVFSGFFVAALLSGKPPEAAIVLALDAGHSVALKSSWLTATSLEH